MAKRTRAKGYAEWQPRAHTRALIASVNEILMEYREHLPLTIRQVFYRLVGVYGYPKRRERLRAARQRPQPGQAGRVHRVRSPPRRRYLGHESRPLRWRRGFLRLPQSSRPP